MPPSTLSSITTENSSAISGSITPAAISLPHGAGKWPIM